jgi:hypothetical protein
MKNKEFLEFILGNKETPVLTKELVKKDISLSFRGRSIVLKFLAYFLLGALFSMSVCPQFGLGLVEGHGITHVFRLIGDWACAAFCGALFLSSGIAVTFMGMKGEEIWWVWRRYKFSLILLPTVMWSGLMLTNVSLNLPSESLVYHATWITAALMIQFLLMNLRTKLVFKQA